MIFFEPTERTVSTCANLQLGGFLNQKIVLFSNQHLGTNPEKFQKEIGTNFSKFS